MGTFDEEYWNLCQAAVWIEFRERLLVERFSDPDGEAYRALHFYPEMWPPGRVRHGHVNELVSSLKSNSLKAVGYHRDTPEHPGEIPPLQWYDIDLRPPHALDARARGREVWTSVRVRRRDILRLWPIPTDLQDRSWFDWESVRAVFEEVQSESPDLSERQAILETQVRYERRFKKKPPGRSSLQNRMKQWRNLAT